MKKDLIKFILFTIIMIIFFIGFVLHNYIIVIMAGSAIIFLDLRPR